MGLLFFGIVCFAFGWVAGRAFENEGCARLMETHLCDISQSNEKYDALPLIPFKQGWKTPGMKGRAAGIRARLPQPTGGRK